MVRIMVTGGNVDFPVRLMVNTAGDVDADGNKHYKLLTNFLEKVSFLILLLENEVTNFLLVENLFESFVL